MVQGKWVFVINLPLLSHQIAWCCMLYLFVQTAQKLIVIDSVKALELPTEYACSLCVCRMTIA